MTSEPRARRSDAHRNHETILTAAIAVLAHAPQATMRDIATASGTGRTTLYRHFPDREALVGAIYERVLNEADEITTGSLRGGEGGDPVEVIAALCVSLAALGDRYRFLERHDAGAAATDPHDVRRRGEPLRDYLAAAQREGGVAADLGVDWLFGVIVALITEAAVASEEERGARDEMLRRTVRRVLAAS